MGQSHAIAHHANPGFEIVGLANRSAVCLPEVLRGYPMVKSLEEGLALKPDIVSVNTYTGSHVDYVVAAMEAGAHVFVEKPLPAGVEKARRVVETAKRTGRKLVIGYIVRHHPSWIEFIRLARPRSPFTSCALTSTSSPLAGPGKSTSAS
jgi:predicted dehydrogenase